MQYICVQTNKEFISKINMKCVYALIRFLSHYLWSPLSYPCFNIPESSAIVTRSINSKGPFWSYQLIGCQHCPGQMVSSDCLLTGVAVCWYSSWPFLTESFWSTSSYFILVQFILNSYWCHCLNLQSCSQHKRINMLYINTCMHGHCWIFHGPNHMQ